MLLRVLKIVLLTTLILLVIFDIYSALKVKKAARSDSLGTPSSTVQNSQGQGARPATSTSGILSEPLTGALSRVTKKPFGIKVSPGNSPVSPERFSGYHTGADFEILPGEENMDVQVLAVCDGILIYKNSVSGYGGVAIQSCVVKNAPITALYGHLRLGSITLAKGTALKSGQEIGVLGTGYSTETDGERKHLHLSIHKGTAIDLLGYVQKSVDLAGWIDPVSLLK
jgi:hypothetical protein